MKKVLLTLSSHEQVLENLIDRQDEILAIGDQPIDLSGVFLHQHHSVASMHIEDAKGNRAPIAPVLQLASPGMARKHPRISGSGNARYRIRGIPLALLERGIVLWAEMSNGERIAVARGALSDLVGILAAADRLPTKRSSLRFLRENGLGVGTIIDVGVRYQTKELIDVFPDVKHLLFEPIAENYRRIKENYAGMDYELIEAAASDRDGHGTLELRTRVPGSNQILSTIAEPETVRNDFVVERRPIEEITLDSAIGTRSINVPFVLKIDVDGNELKVLAGASQTLKNTSCVVIEAPLGELVKRAVVLEGNGFILWDVIDLGYYKNQLGRVDLVFLSSSEKRKPAFQPFRPPFDPRAMRNFLH